ncbi:MAG TPA: thioredoxin family protein [Pseudonocardiaceae bacterium]|nr:thioredoxin family protein [Pseudonocardiaceae bacterium]
MATIELTKENFNDAVGEAGLALIDFWASWCRPCRTFGPIFEQVSENHPDAVFGTVDTEAQRELAAAFRVMSIPTLVIMREGLVLYAKSGALPEQALEELVRRARALDMDEVRHKRAARQRTA